MGEKVEVEGLAIVDPEEAVGKLAVVAEVVEVRHLGHQDVVVQPVDVSGQHIAQGRERYQMRLVKQFSEGRQRKVSTWGLRSRT